MAIADTLPNQLCTGCTKSATGVIPFIRLAKDSSRRWHQITDYLFTLEDTNPRKDLKKRKNVYVKIGDDIQTHVSLRYKEAPMPQRLKNLKKTLNRSKTGGKKCVNAIVRCPECNKLFTKIYKLNIHMRVVNKKMCSYCKEICHIRDFEDHVRTHGVTVSSCRKCYRTFENVDRFLKHKKRCKKHSHACIDCTYSFSSSEQLVYHLPVHHAKTCSGCFKIFSNKACFEYHSRLCNRKAKQSVQKYICDYCSKEYECKSVLKLHIIHTHMSGLKYQCEVCGKKFSSRQHLDEHENTHIKIDDRFVCEVCEAKFSSRRGYQKHLTNKGHYIPHLSDDGKLEVRVPVEIPGRYGCKLQCSVCFQMFAYKKRLRQHMKLKHKIVKWNCLDKISMNKT